MQIIAATLSLEGVSAVLCCLAVVARAEAGVPLDPTDEEGQLSEWPEGSFWPFPDDVTLARMNEPLPGGVVSVTSETDSDDNKKVFFVTTRDIREGEEIYIDYGPKFDRSGYGPPSP